MLYQYGCSRFSVLLTVNVAANHIMLMYCRCFRVTPRNLFMDGKVSLSPSYHVSEYTISIAVQLAQQNGMSSPYFPSFYGELLGPFHDLGGPTEMTEIDKNTTFRLAYKATHTQNSLVTLTFTAESVSFVENWLDTYQHTLCHNGCT